MATLEALFQTTCNNFGDHVAIMNEDSSSRLTYRELNRRADVLTKSLQQILVADMDDQNSCITSPYLVSVMTRRNIGMMVSILAVLKAGAAYVPVDPSFPPERQSHIFSHSKSKVLIVESTLYTEALRLGIEVPTALIIDAEGFFENASFSLDMNRDQVLKTPVNDIAYVLYTSGSTGKPKGVMVMHKGVINTVKWFAEELNIGPYSVVLGLTTYCFDISVLEMFMPLLHGGTLVIADSASQKDPFRLLEVISQHKVTVVQATPTTYEMMLATGWTGDKNIDFLVGGEAFRPSLVPLISTSKSLRNVYGPTETTIWSSSYNFNGQEPRQTLNGSLIIPIGKPISETVFYMVVEEGGPPRFRLAAAGEEGELWIGGTGVAKGYIHAPDLTEKRFLVDPFMSGGDAGMVYRTGDLVSRLEDGNYVFVRRLDDQVKVNGYRIELAEIEVVLGSFSSVDQAVVIIHDNRLLAFVKVRGGGQMDEDGVQALRAYAGRSLTAYMMPSRIIFVDTFPQTANGKLDRKALADHFIATETVSAPENHHNSLSQASKHADATLLVDENSGDNCDSMVHHVLNIVERLRGYRLRTDASLSSLGVDSLGSILFIKTLSDSLGGMRIDVKTAFGPDVTVRSLADILYTRMESEKPDLLATLHITCSAPVTPYLGGDDVECQQSPRDKDDSVEEDEEESFQRLIGSNLQFYEGLRGILILLILWDHFGRFKKYHLSTPWLADTSLYIMLSGFTTALQLRPTRGSWKNLTRSLGARGNGPVWDWYSFLTSRAVGVFPMLWLTMLIAIPRWIGLNTIYKRQHDGATKSEEILCTVMYVIGIQTWQRKCHYFGPFDLYFSSDIWTCFLIYTACRLIIHAVQYNFRKNALEKHQSLISSKYGNKELLLPDSQIENNERNERKLNENLTPEMTLLGWFENRLDLQPLIIVMLVWHVVFILSFLFLKVTLDINHICNITQYILSFILQDDFLFLQYFLAGVAVASVFENIYFKLKCKQSSTFLLSPWASVQRPSFYNYAIQLAPDLCMSSVAVALIQGRSIADPTTLFIRFVFVPYMFMLGFLLISLQRHNKGFCIWRLISESKVFVMLGYASYPIYLLQQVLLNFYTRILVERKFPYKFGVNYDDSWFGEQEWWLRIVGCMCLFVISHVVQVYFQDGMIARLYGKFLFYVKK